MKVAYVHGGKRVPSVMFRMPFFDSLTSKGWKIRGYPSIPDRYGHWPLIGWRASQAVKRAVRQLQCQAIRIGGFDTTVLETGIFHTDDDSIESKLRSVSKRLVYEIDDAVFLLFPKKVANIASISDHVIAGNEAIADWIRPHNDSISIIPTCVDQQVYRSKWEHVVPPSTDSKQTTDRPLVVGWIGSAGNVEMLRACIDPLIQVSRNHHIEIRIVTNRSKHGSMPTSASGLIRWIDIDRTDSPDQIRKFDVGLMPLPQDESWSRYKCNAKVVQYMASGVVPVGSDTGFNRTLIRHGETGFLADNEDGWAEALTVLAESEPTRRRMGKAASDFASDSYTVASRITQYAEAVAGKPASELA